MFKRTTERERGRQCALDELIAGKTVDDLLAMVDRAWEHGDFERGILEAIRSIESLQEFADATSKMGTIAQQLSIDLNKLGHALEAIGKAGVQITNETNGRSTDSRRG